MLSFDHCEAPIGLSPQLHNASPCEAPVTDRPEEVVVVDDARLAPNKVGISRPVCGICGASNPTVATRRSL
jgi:hypothetical protein